MDSDRPGSRRPHWAGELAVLLALLVLYDHVAGLADVRTESAFAHGRALLSPGDLERSANGWLASTPWLHDPTSYYYDLAHINVTLGVFLLCYLTAPAAYRMARTTLVLISVAALAVFWTYPVAPPRLLPDGGFTDIVAESGTWGAWEAGGNLAERANEFGAMPSLHLAWATWVALTVWQMTAKRWLRGLACAHVAVTSLVVVLTGNHYLVDLVAGAALAGVCWLLARTATSQPLVSQPAP